MISGDNERSILSGRYDRPGIEERKNSPMTWRAHDKNRIIYQKVYIYIVYIQKKHNLCKFGVLSYGKLMGIIWVSYGPGSTHTGNRQGKDCTGSRRIYVLISHNSSNDYYAHSCKHHKSFPLKIQIHLIFFGKSSYFNKKRLFSIENLVYSKYFL